MRLGVALRVGTLEEALEEVMSIQIVMANYVNEVENNGLMAIVLY